MHTIQVCFTNLQLQKKIIFTFFILLLFAFNTQANNIVGIDLKYAYVSGNTYKITCTVYNNCSSAITSPGTASPEICIYNDTTYLATIHLALQSPIYEQYLCTHSPDSTNCTNTAYPYPGIKKYIYEGTYTLPAPATSHFWRFIFNGNMVTFVANRVASVTNIASPSKFQLIDTLDNTWHNNSSPNLLTDPPISFCLDSADTYNPTAIDPDGDTLWYGLVAGISGIGICSSSSSPVAVTYVYPYSPTNPFAASAYTFSNITGEIDFTPNVMQRSVVVYNIREYRNDTFIGTSQREMTVYAITTCSPTCIDTLPVGIKTINYAENIQLYPNPTTNLLSIKTESNTYYSLIISNILGQTILQQPINSTLTNIDIANLLPDVYFLTLKGTEGTVVKRFLKL